MNDRLEARTDDLVTFCLSREAIARGKALAASIEDQAVTDERGRVVKHLRKLAAAAEGDARLTLLELAGIFANGEHVHGKPVPLTREGGLPGG